MCPFISRPPIADMCFSPGIIHGAHEFLPTSPGLTRTYSVVHYPQILRLNECCVISCLVCFARRSLVAFHNVNLSWEYPPQVYPTSHYASWDSMTTIARDYFQSASSSSSSPSDDPLSLSSSSLSCSLNWWIMLAPTIRVFCRFSSSFRSLTSSPLASG